MFLKEISMYRLNGSSGTEYRGLGKLYVFQFFLCLHLTCSVSELVQETLKPLPRSLPNLAGNK